MRLSGFILMILVVGLIFAIVGSIVSDFETQYPDVEVNKSWSSKYDFSSEINEIVSPLKTRFETITDTGWFSRIEAGITAVPIAIITVPAVLFKTVSYGITIFSGVGADVGIPPAIITFGIIAILVIIIFALVAFWRRYKA